MTDIGPDQRDVICGLLNLLRNLGLITGASEFREVFAVAPYWTGLADDSLIAWLAMSWISVIWSMILPATNKFVQRWPMAISHPVLLGGESSCSQRLEQEVSKLDFDCEPRQISKLVRSTFLCVLAVFVGCWTEFSAGAVMTSTAADKDTNDPALLVKSWRTGDGLPQNSVLALAQTPDGYLWIGTRGGLARFDGVRFRSYGLADGLKGLSIWSLAEDGQGGLWIGTLGGGLSHWLDGKITTWTTADGLAHNDVMALAAAGPGAVWVGTKRGLQHFGPEGFTTVGDAADLRREVVALATDREGGLWVTGEWSGLYYCKAGICELVPGPSELPKVHSYSLVVDTAGDLWISPGNGFVMRRQRMGAWTVFTQKDGVPYEFIRSLAQGASGEIWGASPNAGLYVFREGRFHAVPGINSSARSVLMSREGILWAGTPTSGLCRLTPKRLAAYLVGQEDHPVTVTSLVEATPGEFLVATYGNGLFQGSLDRLEPVQIEKTLVDRPHLASILKMRDGVVWIGGAGVLARRKPGVREFQAVSLVHNLVALCEGADGTLWLGSREGELLHLVDDKPQPVAQGSVGALVSALMRGDGSSLWVATQGAGLVRWENGQVQRWTTKEGLPTDVVRALHRDANGTLWIGTAGGGIAWLEAGRIRVVNSQSGLADDFISQILEDDDGNLWLGGNNGISRVSKRELRAVASGQAVAVHPLVVDESDGMLAAECTGGYSPAGWRSPAGKLHFSTMRGVAVVDPAQFGPAPSPPAARIEEVKLDGKPIPMSGGLLSLPPGPRELQILYTAFNYAKPEQMRFRYRLAGRGEEWEEVNRARFVRFTQLRPGDYTFQVSAANQDGRWHETGASLAFTVQPFYWQTVWFRVIGALLLIASGGAAVWRSVRVRVRRTMELESLAIKLRESEERMSLAAEAADFGMWAWIIPRNEVWGSQSWRRLLGFTPDAEINYKEVIQRLHPDDRERVSREVRRAAAEGTVYMGDYRVILPDGTQRWFLTKCRTYLDAQGKPSQMLGASIDITERKRIEEANRNAQELMAAIFNSVPGLLYLYTADGRLVRWNRQHEELTGYTSQELLNFPIQNWFADEDQIKLAQEFSKVLTEGTTLVEMNLLLKNGEKVPHSFTGTKVTIDGKPFLVGIGINISARKRAEAASRNAQELTAAIFNSVPGLLYLYSEDGQIVQWNKQHEVMTGFTSEELLNRRARDWYDEADRVTFDQAIRTIFSEGYAEAEMKLIHKNGEKVPYALTASKVIIDGKPHLVGIAINISLRKKAEASLRESEARYRDIFEGAIEGIYRFSLSSEILTANPAMAEILGYDSAAEMIRVVKDSTQQVWAHPAERSHFIQLLEERGVVRAYECQFKRKDGTRIWVSINSRIVRESAGGMAYFDGFMEDITERRRAIEQVRQLSHAMEQSPVSVVITDLQGKIIFVNRKFSEVSGYSAAECLGQNPRLVKSDESSAATYVELWACITAGGTWRGEFHNRKKSGELYWESAVISPLFDTAGKITHYVGVKEDTTARKQAEAEALRQRAELAHVARVSTMGELAASVAHELNQPLGAILANAEAAELFLSRTPPALGELRDILTDIRKDDERASEVIRRMRALLRKNELDQQPLAINSVVEDALQVVSSDAALRKMAMSADLASGLPKILGDRIHLQQVLLNLLLNGMDAMADVPRDRRRLSLRTRLNAEGWVEIAVMDSGHGIAPDSLPKLFEPFYTTKPNGMGMGLSISRTIIAAHHGRITAENNAAGGATFRVTLPAVGEVGKR